MDSAMAINPRQAIVVRPLENGDESDQLFGLGIETFAPGIPVETNAAGWRETVARAPGFHPSHVRGAFRNGVFLGGYFFHERWMRVGASRLLTGCISGVVRMSCLRGIGG